MSFNRPFLESSPLSNSPPASPWRARADILRRRPHNSRRLAALLAALLFCSVLFLARYRADDRQEWIMVEDTLPVPPLPAAHLAPPHTPDIHNETHAPAVVETPPPDAVVFSLIMFSEDSATEGAILMKSIVMYSSLPIEFHIICDGAAQAYLEHRLRLVTRPAHDILVRFYLLSWPAMLARIEREGAVMSDHSAGIPGLMKLFIHEILPPSVPRAIFLDTDAFFVSDPALLWDRFRQMDPRALLALPTHPEMEAPHWHHANRICSCIMLLALDRLREVRLMDSSAYRASGPGAGVPALGPPAFEAMFGAPGASGHYEDVKLGDQGYWYAIAAHRPELVEHLAFDWEVSSCLLDMYLTGLGEDARGEEAEAAGHVHTEGTPSEGEAVLPKMLHFNCLDGTPRYYEWEGWADPENSLTKRWWPAVQYHVGFKWIWLNAHRALGALRIETVRDVVFADELNAHERARKLGASSGRDVEVS